MNIVLSSNPYRDKGLRAAQEARKILEKGYLFGKEVIKKIEDAGMENEKQ